MFKFRGIVRLASLFVLPLMLIIFSACNKDDDKNDNQKVQYTLSASLNGQQEVPAITTGATGTMSGTYNKSTKALTYSISWQQLSGPATGMHFHGPALAGEPAGVALAIEGFTAAAQGTHNGTATLSATQEADLLAGKWYVNIHTDQNKGGEIRGQVSAQ